jgi:hypothetical protein
MANIAKSIVFGWKTIDKIRVKNSGKRLVISYEAVGDLVQMLAWLKAYKAASDTPLAVLTTKPQSPLFRLYKDSYDELIPITSEQKEIIVDFFKTDLGQLYRTKYPEVLCLWYTTNIRTSVIRNTSTMTFSEICKAVLHLPMSEKATELTIGAEKAEYIADLIDKEIIDPGHTVIINPYAKSCVGTPIEFFGEVAYEIKKRNFKLISSTVGSQKPVEHTQPMEFDLCEAAALFCSCGHVIGARSGFLDLAAQCSCKIAAVDNDIYEYSDFYRIEGWGKKNCKTFHWNRTANDKIVSEIVEYITDERNGESE